MKNQECISLLIGMTGAIKEIREDQEYINTIKYAIKILELEEEVLSDVQPGVIQKIVDLIDCEIDCIKSGNILTPSEQDIAIKVCENIKERFSNFTDNENYNRLEGREEEKCDALNVIGI